MQVQQKEKLLFQGAVVVDLGAAPGGWSQVAAGIVGPAGRVIAVDRLDFEPLEGVEQIRGDFADESIVNELVTRLGPVKADIVMSDMAPHISGNWSVDQPRALQLAELALDFAVRVLRPGGSLLLKLFQGEGTEALVAAVRGRFGAVHLRKPAASRAASREIYVVARNYRV